MAYKVFSNGSVLNASEINDNLMRQSVMVFSNAAARSAALTVPLEGMLTWLEDQNRYEYRNGAGAWVTFSGGILQTLSTTKTDTFTTTSTTYSDVTGLSVTITPASTSNKILVSGSINIGSAGFATNAAFFKLVRGATDIAIGDTAGSRIRGYSGSGIDTAAMMSSGFQFLDSPATVAALTYKIQLCTNVSGQTASVNRWVTDTDNNSRIRGVSTITVMEVAG